MKSDIMGFLDFIERGRTLLDIPVYQRNYEWGQEECNQLFTDLINVAKQQQPHFLGVIVYVTEKGPKTSDIYQIIDGQQRIMSMLLLLKALSEANVDDSEKDEINNRLLTDKLLPMNDHYKLRPVSYDAAAFDTVMNGLESEYDEPSKVIENYKFFQEQIHKVPFTASELFESLRLFNIAYISLTKGQDEENPQLIFESLNSTGASLTASDLVRNFLLMNLDNSEQNRFYKQYWVKIEKIFNTQTFTKFLRRYLITQTSSFVNKNAVYKAYKDFYNKRNLTSQKALAELLQFARYYNSLLKASTNSPELNKIFSHINIMDVRVVYPYFMKLLNMLEDKQIQIDEVIRLCKIMESYVFRLKIAHHTTSGVNRVVIRLCHIDNPADLVNEELEKIYHNFPDDLDFLNGLRTDNIYKQGIEFTKMTLSILEESQTKETVNFDKTQIEHIMPQHLSPQWEKDIDNAEKVNKDYGYRLGNLTLTGYNQTLSNKPYREKRKIYQDSNIIMTRKIAKIYDFWNKDTILKRTDELANDLIKIYPRPELPSQEIKKENGTVRYNLQDSVEATNKKIKSIILDDHRYKVNSWRQAFITFLNYVWVIDSHNFDLIKEDKSLNKELFENIVYPAKLDNNVNVETHFAARQILSLITRISNLCSITDSVQYEI